MSNHLMKNRTDWTASLGWLVQPVILFISCGLLVSVGVFCARLTEDNLSGQIPSQRDNARSERDTLQWHPVKGSGCMCQPTPRLSSKGRSVHAERDIEHPQHGH